VAALCLWVLWVAWPTHLYALRMRHTRKITEISETSGSSAGIRMGWLGWVARSVYMRISGRLCPFFRAANTHTELHMCVWVLKRHKWLCQAVTICFLLTGKVSTRAGIELEMLGKITHSAHSAHSTDWNQTTHRMALNTFALTLQQTANEHNDSCIVCVFHVYRIICNPWRNNNGAWYDDDARENGNPLAENFSVDFFFSIALFRSWRFLVLI